MLTTGCQREHSPRLTLWEKALDWLASNFCDCLVYISPITCWLASRAPKGPLGPQSQPACYRARSTYKLWLPRVAMQYELTWMVGITIVFFLQWPLPLAQPWGSCKKTVKESSLRIRKSHDYGTPTLPNRSKMLISWYQEFLLLSGNDLLIYQKLFPDIKKWFSDIRKSVSDGRKYANFWVQKIIFRKSESCGYSASIIDYR